MKKGLKITLWSLLSLVALVIVVVAVVCWLVLTPSKLTKIVNSVADKYILCESHFDNVDLTLVKTFPKVGLDVKGVTLVNPMEGCPNDTLASIKSLAVGVDIKALLKDGSIIVNRLNINKPRVNIYFDTNGNNNLDIFPPSEDTTESGPLVLPNLMDVDKLVIRDLCASYTDAASGMTASLDETDLRVLLRGKQQQLHAGINLEVPRAQFSMGKVTYLDHDIGKDNLLKIDAKVDADLDSMSTALHKVSIALIDDALKLGITGNVLLPTENREMDMDVDFDIEKVRIGELLKLIPKGLKIIPQSMGIDALVGLKAKAKGKLGEGKLPLIGAEVDIKDGNFIDKSILPWPVEDIEGVVAAELDLSDTNAKPSSVEFKELKAHTGAGTLTLKGKVDDLNGKMAIAADVKGLLDLPQLMDLVYPDTAGAAADFNLDGKADLNLYVETDKKQLETMKLAKTVLRGTVDLKRLRYNTDSMMVTSPLVHLNIDKKPNMAKRVNHQLALVRISSESLHAVLADSDIDASIAGLDLDAAVSDVLDSTVPLAVDCDFKFRRIKADMDSIEADLTDPQGHFAMFEKAHKQNYDIQYNGGKVDLSMGKNMSATLAGLALKASAVYDSTKSNALQQWSPVADINVKNATVQASSLPYTLQVPGVRLDYNAERLRLTDASLLFGNSDIFIGGTVYGLAEWLSHEGMLRGDLTLTSNYTNVDDLLDALSGLGTDEDTLASQRKEDNVPAQADPFIVPRDVDFTLHTRFRGAQAFGNELSDLGGDISIKDGVAVLNEIGFVCKAARMQLTAIYRTPRVNHIFLGMDFHLLDIYLDELVDMIPYVDTLLPMITAFSGKADFHLCAETYLDAFYKPKMSTLRGAAAITGDSLVVMDDASVSRIMKLIGAKDWRQKDEKLMIDSLDVAMTVFRKEVEVYPFSLTMNKYNLVVAGRHNLDMNYDYHLELLKSPLPARLAVDVVGVMPKLNFQLSKLRYAELFVPEKRNDVQQRTLALKKLIRESLEANVKQETRNKQRTQ
ncbi:MAG: AsmA family protein [Bacteroidales bacterium]|nr:AsmA family protein [Bacteroidales bacterium]